MNKFNITYNRVIYGNIGEPSLVDMSTYPVYEAPSNISIHVWYANQYNWNNKPDIKIEKFGRSQAPGFDIQKIGVFGIVTTIVGSNININNIRRLLLENSKTNHLDSSKKKDSRVSLSYKTLKSYLPDDLQSALKSDCI